MHGHVVKSRLRIEIRKKSKSYTVFFGVLSNLKASMRRLILHMYVSLRLCLNARNSFEHVYVIGITLTIQNLFRRLTYLHRNSAGYRASGFKPLNY